MNNNRQLIGFRQHHPKIGKNVFLADGSRIIGDVDIGDNSNIWFNSVVRGDVAGVRIGSYTNLQDNSVIHTASEGIQKETIIGNHVTIGHMSLIHACVISDYGFIGMGSVIMDGANIKTYGFVAAGSLVTQGKIVGSHELWAGRPAKFIRKITDLEQKHIKESAQNYVALSKYYIE